MNNIALFTKIVHELTILGYQSPLPIAKEIYSYCNEQEKNFEKVFTKLKKGIPWEYIQGYTYFRGNRIYVTKDTLIPRPETEQIIDIFRQDSNEIENVYDIGSGTGCISIAIKKEFQNLDVHAVEISENTIEVLKRNVKENNLDIEIIKSDLLSNVSLKKNSVIIANLPYIPTKDYMNLDKSVKNFEPQQALEGGTNGLKYINELIKQIKDRKEVKYSIFEIDPSQEKELSLNLKGCKYQFTRDFRGLVRFLKFSCKV